MPLFALLLCFASLAAAADAFLYYVHRRKQLFVVGKTGEGRSRATAEVHAARGARAFLQYKRSLLQLLADQQPRMDAKDVLRMLPPPTNLPEGLYREASGGQHAPGRTFQLLHALRPGQHMLHQHPGLPLHEQAGSPWCLSCLSALVCSLVSQASTYFTRFVSRYLSVEIQVLHAVGGAALLELRPFRPDATTDSSRAPHFQPRCQFAFHSQAGCKHIKSCRYAHAGQRKVADRAPAQ